MNRTLEAEIENRDGVAIIDLKGEISSRAENSFFNAYGRANSQSSNVLLLNMEEVEYINSAGIALIIRLIADARQKGTPVAVSGLNEHYREIFHITRLDDFVTLYADRNDALQALASLYDEQKGRRK